MSRFYTDEEMQKIQNMDRNILKQNYNNMSIDKQNQFKQTYQNTLNKQKFGGFEGKELQGAEGYNENQIGIPGVNMVAKNNQNTVNQTEAPKIQGMNAVKFRDEPNGDLDLTFDNFLNVETKLNRGEKLNFSEAKLLQNIKTQRNYLGKSMQEIFGIETKTDKEAKYKNLALENRNIRARDLRNSLASQGLNYDEIEKVVGHHQIYDQLMIEEEKKKQMDEQRLGVYTNALQKQFADFENSARKRGEQRMNYLNSSLSFSGFGRSSHAIERRDEVITSVNEEISKQQALMQAQILEKMAELQGAEPETLANLRKQTMEYTLALQNQQTENAKLAQALNDEANANLTEALNNMIALSGVNPKEVDVERSKLLGFAADKYGNAILKDENGKAIMIRSAIENENEMNYKREKDERDYNFNVYKDGRDFEYGAYKDERDFGLKTAEFNHKSSMDRAGLQIDYEKLGLEREKFDYGKDKDALDYDLKKTELNYKMNEDDIKQAKQDKKDLQNALYAAEDAKTMSDEFESLKGNWMAERQLPSISGKIDRLKTSLAFMKIQNLKAQGISMNPMTEKDFEAVKDSVATLKPTMSQIEFEKEIERIQGVIEKGVDRNVGKYNLKYDFDTGEVIPLNNAGNNKNSQKKYSEGSMSDYLDGKTDILEEENVKNNYSATNKTKKDIKNNVAYSRRNFPKADQTALTKAIPRQAMNLAFSATRSKGQCGAFVNDYVQKLTGRRIMGDSYVSKEKHINSDTPQLGGLAVWNPGGEYVENGHTGIVIGVSGNYVIIRDANWKGDEKVMTRKVPIKTILASRGGGKGGFVNFS